MDAFFRMKILGNTFIAVGVYITTSMLYLGIWSMGGEPLQWPLQWLDIPGIISLGVIGIGVIFSGAIMRHRT